jgi:glycerophosphoryl diester phosphodiesterase
MALTGRLPWTLRPVAHRGLHDARGDIIENTWPAFAAAIAAGYAIETDIQAAAENEPVVFHDETLGRLTRSDGAVARFSPTALRAIPFKTGDGRILALGPFLERVAARVPVYLEVKTAGAGARGLVEKIVRDLAQYQGPAAVMSFDPAAVRAMRRLAPRLPRGLVSMRFTKADWPHLSALARFRLTQLLDFRSARPDFLAYHVDDLPQPGVSLLRRLGVPVLAWTVRNEAQRQRALAYADAIIFEELRP